MATKLDYVNFNTYYTNIKDAVGDITAADDSTIGGVINSSNALNLSFAFWSVSRIKYSCNLSL